MTAYEAYYKAIENGEIPATVIIEDVHGRQGMATIALKTEGNSQAEEAVYSDEPEDRAIAAIFACQMAMQSIEKHYGNLIVPVAHSRI